MISDDNMLKVKGLISRTLLFLLFGILAGCEGGAGIGNEIFGGDDPAGSNVSSVHQINGFDDAGTWGSGWLATGDAFLRDDGTGTMVALKPPQGGWGRTFRDGIPTEVVVGTTGDSLVFTFVTDDPFGLELDDFATGSLISPEISITGNFVNLLVDGGLFSPLSGTPTGVEVYIDGEFKHFFTGDSLTPIGLRAFSLDLRKNIGSTIRFEIKDLSQAGFGFVAADNFTFSGVPAIRPDRVLSSFEDALDVTSVDFWVPSGDFAGPAMADSWFGPLAAAGAAIGGNNGGNGRAASTCELAGGDCDSPTGSLESPVFTVNNNFINFAISGGSFDTDLLTGEYIPEDTGVELIDADTSTQLMVYNPSDGSPTLSDLSWYFFNVSSLQGRAVKIRFFDNSVNASGFSTFDHVYLSDYARGSPAVNPSPSDQVAVTVSADGLINANVLGAFDDPAFMLAPVPTGQGWIAGGDFATPTGTQAWRGISATGTGAARVGASAGSTCEFVIGGVTQTCNAATGFLTSPLFTVQPEKTWLNFLMSGGDGAGSVGVEIRSASAVVLDTFSPNTCLGAFIDGDDDWQNIDLSPYVGQSIRLRIFDNSTGDCGFVAFDHFYLSDTPRQSTASDETPVAAIVQLPVDAMPLADGGFEDPVTSTWIGTGDFASPANNRSWEGVLRSPFATIVGERGVSTCEIDGPAAVGTGCDAPTGTLTSPSFTVDASSGQYLNFLMGGGDGANVGVRVVDHISSVVLAEFLPADCAEAVIINDSSNDDFYYFDLSDYSGQQIRLEVFDNSSGSCGFISFDHFFRTDSPLGTEVGLPVPDDATRNVSVPADAFDNVIGDFNNATDQPGWTGTGVFAAPAAPDAWVGTASNGMAAVVGARAVSTCEIGGGGCDAPQGTLSRQFTVDSRYLIFLMDGGTGDGSVGVTVRDNMNVIVRSYAPANNNPSYIDGDSDWRYFDLQDNLGETVTLEIFDNSLASFVSFDHFFLSDSTFGSEVGGPIPDTQTQNVSVNSDAFDNVIGDFNDAQEAISEGWVATGAFASPSQPGDWSGTSTNGAAAVIGARAVSTCELAGIASCDFPTGTITSPLFMVDAQYLNFLMDGGNGSGGVGLEILDAGNTVIATYEPANNTPSYIDGDTDWRHIDLSLITSPGDMIRVRLFDNLVTSFVSFDHIYLADTSIGMQVATPPSATDTVNVTVPADGFTSVVGTFDNPTSDSWVGTGNAFSSPSSQDSWSGTARTSNAAAARVGFRAVGTCEINGIASCDFPTGTLTSPLFTVTGDNLTFLMAGGNGSADVGMRVFDSLNNEIASFVPSSCAPSHIDGNEDWQYIDVSAFDGQQIRVEVYDNSSGACGFISFDHFYLSDGVNPNATLVDTAM